MSEKDNRPFKMTVRRCLRCGGILTSPESIQEGYGHSCKMKEQLEKLKQQQDKLQISLFDEEESEQ